MRETRVDGIYCEGKRRLQLASLRSQIKKKKTKTKKKKMMSKDRKGAWMGEALGKLHPDFLKDRIHLPQELPAQALALPHSLLGWRL